jgi:ATP-dependent exoDNAse (exonuclease V) alpha subunit
VIIPVVRSRLLDWAMLYTAITRARVSAILVGAIDIVKQAVAEPPLVWQRTQALNLDAAIG